MTRFRCTSRGPGHGELQVDLWKQQQWCLLFALSPPTPSLSLCLSLPLSKMRTTAFVSSQLPLSLALCADESSDSCDSRGASQELVLHQRFLGNIGVKQLAYQDGCCILHYSSPQLFPGYMMRLGNRMQEDLGEDQLSPGPAPLPQDSSLISGHHVLEVCMLGSTIPTLGQLSSLTYSKCVWPANHTWHQWGLQNHPHLCFILLLVHLFILCLFSIYWAPVDSVWKSCLHLIPGRVCICIDFSAQLVSFTKSGFELESRCYSQPFLKAVSQVCWEGPTSLKKSYISWPRWAHPHGHSEDPEVSLHSPGLSSGKSEPLGCN